MELTPMGIRPESVRRAVGALAAVDWLIAVVMIITGTRREVALPVALVAGLTTVALQRRWLTATTRAADAARRRGADPWVAVEIALRDRFGATAARWLLREPRLLWSLSLMLRRRYDGYPNARFGTHRDALPTWLLIAGLAGVEVALTPLLRLPPTVEWLLLLAGGWGLLVTAGMIAALVVHPHLVTATDVRARTGFWQEISVPRSSIASVVVDQRPAPRGRTIDGTTAVLTPHGVTNLTIRLNRPTNIGPASVDTLRIWADVPSELRSALTTPP
jgi:hypothetical protein